VTNNTAQLLKAWSDFKESTVHVAYELKKAAESVNKVTLEPIKKYAKTLSDQNAKLGESYTSLAARIEATKNKIQASTNTKDIAVFTKDLEKLTKTAGKHPGNTDNTGKVKGGGIMGGVMGAIGGLFGKVNPMGILTTVIESGMKAESALPKPPPVPGEEAKNPGTVAEKLETFNGKIEGAIGQVGLAFMPMMSKLMDFAMQLADTLLPMIMQAIQPLLNMLNQLPIEDIFNSVLNVAVAIIAAVGPILEQLTPLFGSIFTMLGPLIQDVGSFIVMLVEGLAPILALVAHIVSAVLGPALILVGKILHVVIEVVKWVARTALDLLKPVIEFVTGLIDGVMRLLGQSNQFNGKGIESKLKTLVPPTPGKDTNATATDVDALFKQGLAGTATAATTTPVAINRVKPKHENTANKTAGEIAGGGPRVININGVKFAEKIEISVINAKEGINHLEAQLQEMFLRILNMGAAVQ
jgi:hypothetical protein